MNQLTPVLGTVTDIHSDGRTGTVQLGESLRALFCVGDGKQVKKNGRQIYLAADPVSRLPVVGDRLVCIRQQSAVQLWAFADDYVSRGGKPHNPESDPPLPLVQKRRRAEYRW